MVVICSSVTPRCPEGRQHVLGDVVEPPVGVVHSHLGEIDEVGETAGVVGQDHLVGVAPLAHGGDDTDPLVEGHPLDAEAVHPEIGAVGRQLLEVVHVAGIAGVADHHAGEVDALLLEHPLLLEPPPQSGMGVGGDGDPGLSMGHGHGSEHPFDAGREARLVGCALEDGGLHAGATDTFDDVLDEEAGHHLVAAQHGAGTPKVEVLRDVVVGVDAGGDDDVHVDPFGHLLDAWDVAAGADDRAVDDRLDPAVLGQRQLFDGVGDPDLVLEALGIIRPVLHDLGARDEHVLVHERRPHRRYRDRAPSRLHHCLVAHDCPSFVTVLPQRGLDRLLPSK